MDSKIYRQTQIIDELGNTKKHKLLSKGLQCSHKPILNPGNHTQTPVLHTKRSIISHLVHISAMRIGLERREEAITSNNR